MLLLTLAGPRAQAAWRTQLQACLREYAWPQDELDRNDDVKALLQLARAFGPSLLDVDTAVTLFSCTRFDAALGGQTLALLCALLAESPQQGDALGPVNPVKPFFPVLVPPGFPLARACLRRVER